MVAVAVAKDNAELVISLRARLNLQKEIEYARAAPPSTGTSAQDRARSREIEGARSCEILGLEKVLQHSKSPFLEMTDFCVLYMDSEDGESF